MENKDHLIDFTIPQLLRWRVKASPHKVALREKDFGCWNNITWQEYYDLVAKTALGLEKIGLKKEDNLALICDNIPEMLIVSIGTHVVGGLSLGIYQSTLPDEISQILNSLNASIVFCDDQEQVDKLVEVRDQIPGVKKVIYEDARGDRKSVV